MRINVYEAECDVGYTRVYFRGIDKQRLVKEIADRCRKNWKEGDWDDAWWDKKLSAFSAEKLDDMVARGEQVDGPPPIPESDQEVLDTYFWGDALLDPEHHWISWGEYALDLSPPAGTTVRLGAQGQLSVRRLVETATGEPATGGLMEGRLIEDFPQESDALESFILALASEGFPIHTRQFSSALNTAIDAIANNV